MSNTDFTYINNYYGLQVFKGQKVRYKGSPGKVTGNEQQYVKIVLDGQKRAFPYHPTDDDLEYSDANGNFLGDAP